MTFSPESPRFPTSVQEAHATFVAREGTPREYVGRYDFHVLDLGGRSLSNRTGVIEEMPAEIEAAMQQFMDWLLDSAQGASQSPPVVEVTTDVAILGEQMKQRERDGKPSVEALEVRIEELEAKPVEPVTPVEF